MPKIFAIIRTTPNNINSAPSNNYDIYIDENIFIRTDAKLINDGEKIIAIDGEIEAYKKKEKSKWPFVYIIYDKKSKKVSIINDRYGIKPFYYTELKDEFILSSDIKSIIKYPKFTKKLNYNGLLDYILFNFPLEEETFIEKINRLPPASFWSIDIKNQIIKKRNYFNTMAYPISTSINNLVRVLKYSTKLEDCFITLTGGYDTRTILATLLSQGDIPKLNLITFGEDNSINAIIANKIAKLIKSNHIIQEFIPTTMELLYDFIFLSEGLCNISQSTLFCTFRKLKKEKIIMGYGGSELIRGLHEIGLSVSKYAKRIIEKKKSQIDNDTLFLVNTNELKNRFYFYMEKYSKLKKEDRHFYFILEVIRKYYANIIKSLTTQIEIVTPYINSEFIYYIAPLVKKIPPFSNNLFKRVLGQKISASIIKYNYPKLLYITTDRGYPPLYNLHSRYLPAVIFYQIKRRKNYKQTISSAEYILRENVKKILEQKLLSKQFLQNKKLSETIKAYPNWDIKTWIELSKVATFELFLRTFNL